MSDTRVTRLSLPETEVALSESLLLALRESNRLDGYYAQQLGGAYGAIKEALIVTLTCTIAKWAHMRLDDARKIASRLYDEAIDNGESIDYQIVLWNEGVIRPW